MARSLRWLNRLLTWKRACLWAGFICALYVVAYAYVVVNGKPPLNASQAPLGGDYIAFHAAGRLVLAGDGASIYDAAKISATQSSLLHGLLPGFYDAFRNPPFVALFVAPLAAGDLLLGFAAWTLISLACLAGAMWLLLQELPQLRPHWRGLLVLVFAFAPLYFGLIDGENATLSLLLYVLIYRALRRDQDSLAGMWAALGLFKPQLFLVFPVVLVARARWPALVSYSLTGLGLAAVSMAVAGMNGIQAWVRIVLEPEAANAAGNAWRMASLKSFFDALVPTQPVLAVSLYVVGCLVLLGSVVWIWRASRTSRDQAWILACLCGVLIDPHLVDYDLTVLLPAGILGAVRIPQLRWWIVLLYVLLMLRVQVPIGGATLQVSVLVLAWCAIVVLRATAQAEHTAAQWPMRFAAALGARRGNAT